jgi:magnesium transporter
MVAQELSLIYQDLIELIIKSLEKNDTESIQKQLQQYYPAELALVMEALPHEERRRVWPLLTTSKQGQVLHHLHDIARSSLIGGLEHDEIQATGKSMGVDELVEVIDDLPKKVAYAVIESLDEEEGTAGRIMQTEVRTLRPDVNLSTALRYLRRYNLTIKTDSVIVIDRKKRYLGKLFFADLVTGHPGQTVGQIMDRETMPIQADTPMRDIARLFEQRDLVSVAVVNEDNELLGRISISEVLDIIREEADRTLLNMAGLEEDEDLFAPILPSAQRRAIWLGINLVTAFLAAWVIGLFEATLENVVALAILMPIVASMGGIGGSQTLTLAIRGLALGQISDSNSRWLLFKEVAIGGLNGMVWALVVAVITVMWFGSIGIGIVIGAALIINMITAALFGIIIPLVLDKLGIDPALSGSVVLTTVTDVVGFLSFLGLGTLFLL